MFVNGLPITIYKFGDLCWVIESEIVQNGNKI